jgi:hypothetical protein
MKTIQTTIHIQASPEQVWKVLMDFEAYPAWNHFIKRIEGTAKKGAILEVEIQPKGMKAQLFKPEVIAQEANRHFAWLGKLFVKGLFDGEHHFRLAPQADGSTMFFHEERFKGLLVRPLLALIGDNTLTGFEAMNQALADRITTINKQTKRHEIQS